MRVNEIDSVDRTALTMKGIRYEFSSYLNTTIQLFNIVGGSSQRCTMAKHTIEEYLTDMEIFFNEGYPDNDPDVIRSREIYTKLKNIHSQL